MFKKWSLNHCTLKHVHTFTSIERINCAHTIHNRKFNNNAHMDEILLLWAKVDLIIFTRTFACLCNSASDSFSSSLILSFFHLFHVTFSLDVCVQTAQLKRKYCRQTTQHTLIYSHMFFFFFYFLFWWDYQRDEYQIDTIEGEVGSQEKIIANIIKRTPAPFFKHFSRNFLDAHKNWLKNWWKWVDIIFFYWFSLKIYFNGKSFLFWSSTVNFEFIFPCCFFFE